MCFGVLALFLAIVPNRHDQQPFSLFTIDCNGQVEFCQFLLLTFMRSCGRGRKGHHRKLVNEILVNFYGRDQKYGKNMQGNTSKFCLFSVCLQRVSFRRHSRLHVVVKPSENGLHVSGEGTLKFQTTHFQKQFTLEAQLGALLGAPYEFPLGIPQEVSQEIHRRYCYRSSRGTPIAAHYRNFHQEQRESI